jgi:predicted Zn-dependent protease
VAAEKTIVDREPLTEAEDRPSLELSRLGMKLKQGDFTASEKIVNALLDQNIQDARVYDGLAWSIATEDKATPALLNLAEKSARKASVIEQGKDPSILETMARVQFRKGDKAGAIATQEKAMATLPATESPRIKQRYQMALDAYRAGKLPE